MKKEICIYLGSSGTYRLFHAGNAGNAVIDVTQMYICLSSSRVSGLFDAGNVCNGVINIIKWSCVTD